MKEGYKGPDQTDMIQTSPTAQTRIIIQDGFSAWCHRKRWLGGVEKILARKQPDPCHFGSGTEEE